MLIYFRVDRDTVLWSVRVLEQSVEELEAQLEYLQNEENDEGKKKFFY